MVGLDNAWVKQYPFFHDYPGSNTILKGENFMTENILSASPDDYTYTGAYSPFGVATTENEMIKGITRSNGSILRANLDGSDPHSAVMGFDYSYNENFGMGGDVYIAEYGSNAPNTTGGKPLPGVGHRVSKVDMKTGKVTNFADNKSGFAASYTCEGGFERPIDVVFGPDNAMYVVDFAVNPPDNP